MGLATTCQMSSNVVDVVTINVATVTYYWEEENGRKTYRPALVAPTVAPAGVTWRFGDLQYYGSNVASPPMLSVGDQVGWIYTGTTLGWRGFGVIG